MVLSIVGIVFWSGSGAEKAEMDVAWEMPVVTFKIMSPMRGKFRSVAELNGE